MKIAISIISFLSIMAVILLICIVFIWNISKRPILTAEMDELSEQISILLGHNWTYSRTPVIERFQDIKSRHRSLRERHELRMIYIHNQNELVYFYVFRYSSIDNAINRYAIQDEVLFFQLPTEANRYPFIDLTLEINSNSDDTHVACQDIYSESVGQNHLCTAIFRYDANIVVVRLGLQGANDIYISNEQMNEIFIIIDDIFKHR